MSVSFERAAMLIHIIKGAAELGPREANSISALASMELKAMDDEAREEVADRNAAAAAAKAEAEAQARANVEATDDDNDDDGPRTIPSSQTTQVDVARRL